jgi:hypothetical protein
MTRVVNAIRVDIIMAIHDDIYSNENYDAGQKGDQEKGGRKGEERNI